MSGTNYRDGIDSARSAKDITVNTATHNRCRAVWVGTSQALDFSFDGTNWVTFNGCTAGTMIPIQVIGGRVTAGAAAPSTGTLLFLY